MKKKLLVFLILFFLLSPTLILAATEAPAQIQAGYEGVNTSSWNETDPLFFGRTGSNYFHGGVVFENVFIPAGSTITAATLSVYQSGSCSDQLDLNIYAAAADDFTGFSSANRPSNISKTSNFVTFLNTCLPTQTINFSGLENVVGEVIARPNWITGNNLAFALIAAATTTAFFQVYVTDIFTLSINYELPRDNTMFCSIPANDDISIITGCRQIYGSTTSSSTITAIEKYQFYSPAIIFLLIFLVLFLIAIVFIIWILAHDLSI